MCECPSCKATDALREAGFDAWPKAEITPARFARVRAMDAHQLAHADKHYIAHVRRCVPAAPKLDLSAKGARIGTVHTDPRIAYAFPGGQIKQVRFAPGAKLVPHPDSDKREVPYTSDAPEYVRRFCEANHLVSA